MPVKNYLREAMTRQREKPKGPETPPKPESGAAALDSMKQRVDQVAADFSTEGANMGKEGEAGMDEEQKGRWARIKKAAATATTNVREFVGKLFSKKESANTEESAEPTTYDEYNASGPEIKTGALTAEDQQLTTDHEIEDISAQVENSAEVQDEPIINDLAELAIEEEGQRIIEAEQETSGPTQWEKPTTEQAEAMRPEPKIGKETQEAAKQKEKKEFHEDNFDPTNIEEFQQCIDYARGSGKEAGLVRIFRAYLLEHDGDIGIAIREQKRIAESGSAEWTGHLLIPIAIKIADTDPIGAIKFVRSSTDSSEIQRRCFADIAISRAKLDDMQTGITICQECFPQQQEEGSGFSYANSVRARMAENAPKKEDTTAPRAAPETIPNSTDLKAAIGRKKEVPPEITEAQEALDKAMEELAEDGQTAEHIEKNPEIIRLKKELKTLKKAQERKDKPKYIPPSSLEHHEIRKKAEESFNNHMKNTPRDIELYKKQITEMKDTLARQGLTTEQIDKNPEILHLTESLESAENFMARINDSLMPALANIDNRSNAIANEIIDIEKIPESDAKTKLLADANKRHAAVLAERTTAITEFFGPLDLHILYETRPMPKDVLAPRQESEDEDTEPEIFKFDENADGSDESDQESPAPATAGTAANQDAEARRPTTARRETDPPARNEWDARIKRIIDAVKSKHRQTFNDLRSLGRIPKLEYNGRDIIIFDGQLTTSQPVDFISREEIQQYGLLSETPHLIRTKIRAEDIPAGSKPSAAA